MATEKTNRNLCDACEKPKGISKCEGCGKIFCYNHFGNHRQELNEQLDEVEVIRDLFRQTLTEQTEDPQKHTLIEQIDHWERDSIEKIQQTANEAREMLLKHTTKHISDIEAKLEKLTDQLRVSRQENDFVETDLHQWKQQLSQFTSELSKPSTITLQQDSKPLVTKISINITSGRFAYYSYFYRR
jgi:chromosome segregation ATPase